jgi:ABC-type oligopeptide transport system substrate-binding subunit
MSIMGRRPPPIDDCQLDLLAERLAAIRVDRRDALRLAAALAAGGPLVQARRASAGPKLAPGEKLAREQVFRYGGGGWWTQDPSSHDFNKDAFCDGVPALFAGLLKFNADHLPVPDLATKVTPNAEGSQWVFTLRRDARWSDGTPCTARDFEWSWKRQLDPATVAPYATYFYDIKNAEAFNKRQATAAQVGVRARDDWSLEVTLEGPRAYFPILTAYLAALPAHRRAVETHGDRWTEASNIVGNGPFLLERWEHNRVMVLRKNPHYYAARTVTLEKVVIPIIPIAAGALPYENNEIDMTSLQPSDVGRLRANPKTSAEVFRYPFPGTWYLIPQVSRPPFDNLKVRRAVAHAIDRENLVKVAQGFALPAHSMIPPGFPGATDDPRIKALQRFDPGLAMAQLKDTPYEGGRRWPKIVLTMRDEARGSRPLAQAVQAVLLEHLNMPTELEVLDPRVFRERLWKHEFQFVWIRWFMDYPDPHNEYFDTFYGKRTTGKRQAWSNDAFDRELELGRGTRDPQKRLGHYRKAEEILQTDVGYIPVAWVVRYAALKPWVRGLQKTRGGEYAVEGNIYVDMLPHLYVLDRA